MADKKNTRRVTFANKYTDRASGEVYAQGKTYEVSPALARDLIARGKVRPATADEKTTSRPKSAGDEK